MARGPRDFDPDVIYHVGSRSVDKQQIFNGRVPRDDACFVGLLRQAVAEFKLRLFAYCVIWNHFHLVVQAPHSNLSDAMQLVKSEYACWLNAVVGREGALWERRFWHRAGNDVETTAEHIRYTVLNPVRAGLVAHPSRWEPSSYRVTAGLVARPSFVDVEGARELVAGPGATPEKFALFVDTGLPLAMTQGASSGSDPDKTLEVMSPAFYRPA